MGGSGVPANDARAGELLKQSCDGGNDLHCGDLGILYDTGRGGLSKDPSRAAELYDRACKAKNTLSCGNLGALYDDGRGVPKDDARALVLYRQSCDGGFDWFCRGLGLFYWAGRAGLTKDVARAASLAERACRAENLYACGDLGWDYQQGEGVPLDYPKAYALHKRACDGGVVFRCNDQAYLLWNGWGVARDVDAALRLWKKSCDGGVQAACDFLKSNAPPASSAQQPSMQTKVLQFACVNTQCDVLEEGSHKSCALVADVPVGIDLQGARAQYASEGWYPAAVADTAVRWEVVRYRSADTTITYRWIMDPVTLGLRWDVAIDIVGRTGSMSMHQFQCKPATRQF